MRKIAPLFTAFVSIMVILPCFVYSQPPVTDGLVGCWNFEEGTGITAIDSSGNGNNGTIVNATYSTDTSSQSLSKYSLRFFDNPSNGYAYSYVTIPDGPSLRPVSGLTVAAWVKADGSYGAYNHIVSKPCSPPGDSFVLFYTNGQQLWFASIFGWVGGIAIPSANVWHHIAVTYNGSFVQIFVDGIEEFGTAATGSLIYDDNPVLIGADINNGDKIPDNGFNGLIDEVLICDRGLSALEIQTIMSADVSAPDVDTPILNPVRNNVQPNQNVTASVNVTDSESGVKNVTLTYSLDNGTTWMDPEIMNFNNTNNLYEGTIPGQPMGTQVRFEIVAFDNAGNNATKDGTSIDYTYIVVPEFSTTVLLSTLFTTTIFAALVLRRKRAI